MWLRKCLATCLILTALCTCASAARLEWDHADAGDPVQPDGYKIYYGVASGVYSNSVDVGLVWEWPLQDQWPDGIYYFAATAYKDLDESGFSDEVVWAKDTVLPPAPATEIVIIWTQITPPAHEATWSLGGSQILHNPTPGVDAGWGLGESYIFDKKVD